LIPYKIKGMERRRREWKEEEENEKKEILVKIIMPLYH
jgi:hypothetical protein